MKMGLAALYRHFDGLARRERQLMFLAFVAIVWGLTFAAVIDPALARAQALQRRIADHQTQLSAFKNTQEELLRHLGQDVNEKVRSDLAKASSTLQSLEDQIKGFHQTLIPAQAMAKVLGGMLEREGSVQLISLRNISPEPLSLDSPEKNAFQPSQNTKALLYKHGIELVVEGGYFELLGYLSKLEKQPWRMLWTETSLSAEYPKARLRMKLYTLSMDPSWLTI